MAISLPLAEGLDIGPDATWFNAPFAAFDGALAFYLLVVPMTLLGLSLFRRTVGSAEPVPALEPNLV